MTTTVAPPHAGAKIIDGVAIARAVRAEWKTRVAALLMFGHFGEPTGAPVHVMGISHAHVTAGQVHMEWIVTDEVSIWKQIFAHLESRSGA